MMAYWVSFLSAAFASLLSIDKNSYVRFLIPFFVFGLILFVGLRYASVDYFIYETIFSYVSSYENVGFPNYIPLDGEKPVEALYAILILITKSLGGTFYHFVFIVALLSIGIKFYAISKMSNYFFLSLLVYIALWFGKDLGQIRNGLAGSLVLLSVIYIVRGQYFRFNLLALSTMLIHLVGVLSFLLYYLRWFSGQRLMFSVLVFSLVVALMGGIGVLVTELLDMLFGLGNEFRLVRYMESKYAESYSVFGGTVALHLVVSLMSLYFFRRLIAVNKYNSILIPMHIYGLALMLLFIDYGILLARIKDLLCIPAVTVLLPSFLDLFSSRSRLFIIVFFVCCLSLLFYIYMPSEPYTSLLERKL